MSGHTSGHASFDEATLEAAGFPVISFDRLVVGEEFRSGEHLVIPEDVETYAWAVDDHDPWFFGSGPFGGPVAHPTLLANQALFLRHSRYVVPAGLHARMAFEFLGPVRLGTRARTTGRVVDKYVRRDKPYMVTEYRTVDDEGNPLVAGRFTQMLFAGATAPPAGTGGPQPEPRVDVVPDTSIRRAEGRHGGLAVGDPIGPLERAVDQRRIDAYSGVRPGSIHTDPEWAQAKGFSIPIAQGMMSTAYVSALMTDAIGAGFVVGGRMDVRFLRPVHPGTTLTITGTVTGFTQEADGIRCHVDVAAHADDGTQTLAGTASGLTGALG
jgi:acyl dehydratase